MIYLIKKELQACNSEFPEISFFEISIRYHPSCNWIHFDEDDFDDDRYYGNGRGQCLFFAEKISTCKEEFSVCKEEFHSIYGYDMYVYIYFEKLPPGISPYTEESWPLIFKIFDLPTDYSVRQSY